MLSKRSILTLAVSAVLVVPAAADAAASRDNVTGGGQAFFDGREPSGAGDTIAFQAQRARGAAEGSDAATGQIQVNRRGDGAVKFHGAITCLVANGTKSSGAGYAYMSGMTRATKTAEAQPFELYVSDGGKGQMERNDMIMLFVGSETEDNDSDMPGANDVCGFSDSFETTQMARGNVQVRNNDSSEDDDPSGGPASMAAQAMSLLS